MKIRTVLLLLALNVSVVSFILHSVSGFYWKALIDVGLILAAGFLLTLESGPTDEDS